MNTNRDFTEEQLTDERCNCHSYNWQTGETPNVTLEVPDNIRIYTDGRETVCIDACIADAITGLWAAGLPTLNSCCGHNKENPCLIIPEGFEPANYFDALARIDKRDWVVSRWEWLRVDYSRAAQLRKGGAA